MGLASDILIGGNVCWRGNIEIITLKVEMCGQCEGWNVKVGSAREPQEEDKKTGLQELLL